MGFIGANIYRAHTISFKIYKKKIRGDCPLKSIKLTYKSVLNCKLFN